MAADGVNSSPPNVTQLLTLASNRIIALTEDRKGLFYSADAGRRWNQPTDLPDAHLYSVTADDVGDLLLATSAGVFRSQDGAASWMQVANAKAAFIAFNPDGSNLLCKLWGKGLFRTSAEYFTRTNLEDDAEAANRKAGVEAQLKEAWTELMRLKDLPENSPEKLRLPNQYRKWHSLQEQSEQLGELGAGGWEKVEGLPAAPVQTVTFRNRNEAFAGFFGQGAYRSENGGKTWQEANKGLLNKHVLALASSPNGEVFAGTYGGGLFRYSEQNEGWSLVATDLRDGIVQCVAFAASGLMLIGTRTEGVLVSADHGKTWNRVAGALSKANIQALAAAMDGTIFAGVDQQGLFVSADGGRTWAPRPFAYLSYVKQIITAGDGAWYADVRGGGLLKSVDRGQSWTQVALPFPYDLTLSIAIDHGNRLLTGAHEAQVQVSHDGGSTWRELSTGLTGKGVHALRASPEGDVYAVPSDGNGLYRLVDGAQWQRAAVDDEHGGDYTCWNVIFMPGAEAVAYGLSDLLISYKQQREWRRTRFGQPFESLWVDISGRIWTQRTLSTFFLGNDGEWQDSAEVPKDRYSQFVPLEGDILAAIRLEGGVDILRWSGDGLAFMRRGIAEHRVLTLAADRPHTILAGCETGLWISRNVGQTWQEIDLQQ